MSDSGGSAPRGAHRPSRRDVVLRAALGEIVQRGYAAVSMPSIARRAGMSNSSVYYHFSSKEDIVLALLDSIGDALRRLGEEAVDPTGLLTAYLRWMRENPLQAKLYSESAVGASAALEARRRSDQADLVRVIADGALGSFRDRAGPAEITVMAIAVVTLFNEITRALSDRRIGDAEVDRRAAELLAGLLAVDPDP